MKKIILKMRQMLLKKSREMKTRRQIKIKMKKIRRMYKMRQMTCKIHKMS